jgi:hypothetical protein
VVSESQGPWENWNHWKSRGGSEFTAIFRKLIFPNIPRDWDKFAAEQDRLAVSKYCRIHCNH